MKKTSLILLLLVTGISLSAQDDNRKDTVAVIILDHMSNIIGDMHSCSFDLCTSQDKLDVDLGLLKYYNTHQVYMKGPDKMLVKSKGDKGHRGFWYNGAKISYYSFDENNYAEIETPDNIISTIDTVHETYGIDFPAADFFYPNFTDNLIEISDDLIFAGQKNLNGKDCFLIIAKNEKISIQIWVANDAWFLPLKFVIVYYDATPNEQYEATFSNWIVNPDLPDAMFEFMPPPGANELILLPK